VIIVDANLLIYAYSLASPHHKIARSWLEKTFSSGVAVGLPWQTIAAFLRIVTNRKLPGERFTVDQAAGIVDQWLAQPNVRALGPSDDHWLHLREMMTRGQVQGPMITDADLAALTVEYGGVLHTTDRDFARFPGLRWINPLETRES
jgi:hypothetical protein